MHFYRRHSRSINYVNSSRDGKTACRIVCCIAFLFVFTVGVFAGQSDSILKTTPDESPILMPWGQVVDAAFFTGKLSITLAPKGTYTDARKRVAEQRNRMQSIFVNKMPSDSLYRLAQTTLENCIVNDLIPFWYGTRWDFNGYTPTPGKGVVSCGYFVSTILRQCGLVIDRYALAQQNPILEAVSLQLSDSIIVYQCGATTFLRQFTKEFTDGLYFVGLDFHVGFLLVRSGEVVFIHSSYLEPLCVVIEKAIASQAFNASTSYYVAQLSTNKQLVDCWLNGTEITVRTK